MATLEQYATILDKSQEVHTGIKAAEEEVKKAVRAAENTLSGIHTPAGNTEAVVEKIKSVHIPQIKEAYAKLPVALAAAGDKTHFFYKYKEMWAGATQRIVKLFCVVHWLEAGTLMSLDEVGSALGLPPMAEGESNEFWIDLEDYLVGVCFVPEEVARYSANCVTKGDYKTPFEANKFVSELFAGLKQLNFKNGFLRQKFDAVKYDAKRLEQIVYDISIRGLAKHQDK